MSIEKYSTIVKREIRDYYDNLENILLFSEYTEMEREDFYNSFKERKTYYNDMGDVANVIAPELNLPPEKTPFIVLEREELVINEHSLEIAKRFDEKIMATEKANLSDYEKLIAFNEVIENDYREGRENRTDEIELEEYNFNIYDEYFYEKYLKFTDTMPRYAVEMLYNYIKDNNLILEDECFVRFDNSCKGVLRIYNDKMHFVIENIRYKIFFDLDEEIIYTENDKEYQLSDMLIKIFEEEKITVDKQLETYLKITKSPRRNSELVIDDVDKYLKSIENPYKKYLIED